MLKYAHVRFSSLLLAFYFAKSLKTAVCSPFLFLYFGLCPFIVCGEGPIILLSLLYLHPLCSLLPGFFGLLGGGDICGQGPIIILSLLYLYPLCSLLPRFFGLLGGGDICGQGPISLLFLHPLCSLLPGLILDQF